MRSVGSTLLLRRLAPFGAPAAVLAAATAAWWIDHATPVRRWAILFAAATCLGGGLAAWVVRLRPTHSPAERVTAGMATVALRLLPAIAALAWLQTSGSAVRAAGGGELLLIFYLAALAADLARIIMGNGHQVRSPGADRAI